MHQPFLPAYQFGGLSYTPEKQQERQIDMQVKKADAYNKIATANKKGERDPITAQILQARLDDIASRKEDRELKRDEMMRDKSSKLSDKVAPIQNILGAVQDVEGKLGFALDDYNNETGKVLKDGKLQDLDLPGVNILGKRMTFYTTKGRELDTALSKVFNVELKDRSGAAVTNTEMARLKEEFASGVFKTDGEKMDALKRYRNAALQEMKNREAGFSPDVRQLYSGEGGQLSDVFESEGEKKRLGLIMKNDAPKGLIAPSGSQASGKIRVSDGKTSFMIDPADEKDAAKEGFKRVP
jgi:hypothetical protein